LNHLERLRRNWDGLAAQDALWSVLSDPSRRGGVWSHEEFLHAGTHEVRIVFDRLADLVLVPDAADEALDFGCGAGRLTSGLAERFSRLHGVDISDVMLRQARRVTADVEGCDFHLNISQDLRLFEDARFGFVYSNIVLQHMRPELARGYIREFLRVLKPGGHRGVSGAR
jgi:ubiquinone/menaquinone biosynthesis C-methylase UbiE